MLHVIKECVDLCRLLYADNDIKPISASSSVDNNIGLVWQQKSPNL